MKKKIAWLVVAFMLLGHLIIFEPALSFALDVGNGATVTNVKFIKQHVGFGVTGGNVILIGTNLSSVNVLFEVDGGIPKALGTLDPDSNDFFLNYVLDFNEASSFTGKIYVGNKIINLDTPNFPNITNSSTALVNQDQNEVLVLNGSKLTGIDDVNIKATYGRGIQQNNIRDSLTGSGQQANSITFIPTAPGPLGFQDITVSQYKPAAMTDLDIEVTYYYQNAFRIIEDLDVAPVAMYPNAASKGDIITLTSDKFSDSRNYSVYFLNLTDNDFAFSDDKKSPSVLLSADKKRMLVQIPNNTQIELGSKRVVIVDVVNNEIVARYDLTENFNLLDAVFKPTITRINPNSGSDEGANVQVIGRNLITPNIPELVSATGKINVSQATPADANTTMSIDYDETGVTFKGVPVTNLTRSVRTIISKRAFFQLSGGFVKYDRIGADDYLYNTTDIIDDAETNPDKDVLVEIDTRIEDQNGGVYTFSQSVTVLKGFKFIPSSLEPQITKVIPDKVQITGALKPKENTLLTIIGDKFLVNKYTNSSGVVQTNYPVVLVQVTGTLGDGDYIIKFDKNDTTGTPQGTVYDKDGVVVGEGVDLTVLTTTNQVVDGSAGNEVGQKILVYLPKAIDLASGGKKNIQVINPKRGSDDLGDGTVVLDIIDFVQASDTPVIESVTPSIVTADSNETIKVVGSNFQDGVKVYIDGVDVGAITREIDPLGNSMTLTFKAPIGRVTKTQLQVLNPLGGLAVRDFYYVKSFNQDPKITAVSPNKGTADTLAVISGDNFFKPDAAAETSAGLDGYRLIGSRIYIDGKDVNTYNLDSFGAIDFVDYTSPDSNQLLFLNEAGRIKMSPFYKNVVITNSDDSIVYMLTFDAEGNPQIHDGNQVLYTLKYSVAGGYEAYATDGTVLGTFTFNATTITVPDSPAVTFNVRMNNQLIRPTYSLNKELRADVADYWYSVILEDTVTGDFYTLVKLADGSLRLTNGQFSVFTIKTTGATLDAPGFKAVDKNSVAYDVTMSNTHVDVNTAQPLNLKLKTPYVYDSGTRQITGNRMEVITKDKIEVRVPNLASSTGAKDVMVINPDTKSFTLKSGFYYYHLPATQPAIASITPNKGSVVGGYVVTIEGKDFKSTSQIYFDGLLVPPTDKTVNLSGTKIEVKVPKYPVDITEVYGVGELLVPVVVVNNDGGTATLDNGFTYVKPASTPKINQVILDKGSTNGGEIVEIIGEDFRYFEPYLNLGGGTGYDLGIDTFTNINSKLSVLAKWDNLLANRYDGLVDLWEQTPMPGGANYFGYDYYYASPILPRVYFGSELAKIVDFDVDYLKVVTPSNAQGTKEVIVMNNDAGVSNVKTYTFQSSNPTITYINPNQGARTGNELREIVGKGFADSAFTAYQNDVATAPVSTGDKVESRVRFGDITNKTIAVGQPNDGRINANRSTVSLAGGLRIAYDGNASALDVTLEEGGKLWTRTFQGFDGSRVFIPAGMLKNNADYYQPLNYGFTPTTTYNTNTDYEWIMVEVDQVAKRFYVERGYAPKVTFDNSGRLELRTPAYHTIDPVKVYVYTPDGGVASTNFTFKNPASKPIIQSINPAEIIPANTVENKTSTDQWMVQASITGGIDIEIKGKDFRDGVKVFLGTKQAEVLDIVFDDVNNLEVIIAKVPAGQATDIGVKLPIIVENADGGIANSTDTNQLGTDKKLIYFIYRKPLSLPVIKELVPPRTSQYGGNVVEIRGTDFRTGAMVIIGSIGGVPVTPFEIESVGRYIRILIPNTLTPGKKNVQVINTDFGTVTANNALEIVSYPIVNADIKSEDGSKPVSVVYTSGGEKIMVTGSNFQTGAKVVFGGTRNKKVEGMTGEEGFFRDDITYMVQGGTVAPNVKFVDANTLIVTTPEVFEEKDYTLTVINPDKGMSDNNAKVTYSVPVPSAPTSLKVTIVDNQYIKLYDYKSNQQKYYEVYTYLGPKTTNQLMTNNYKDFKQLGTTTLEPYKVSRLDGFNNLGTNDKIYFVLKAVNEYGSSTWSNIAYLSHSQFKSVVALGDPDRDGGLVPGLATLAKTELNGSSLSILFTDQKFSSNLNINLTGDELTGLGKVEVIMPDTMVATNVSRMTVDGKLLDMSFVPYAFNNAEFKRNDTASTEYVTWSTSWQASADTGSALALLPRTVKAVSPVITTSFNVANNTGSRSLGALTSPIDMAIALGAQEVTVKSGTFSIYYFNPSSRTWAKRDHTLDSVTKMIKFKASSPGMYVLTVNY